MGRTTLNSCELILALVVLCCSSRFGGVEPHRTHARLWTDTCSCSALLIKQFRYGRTTPNSCELAVRKQQSTTRASIRPQAGVSLVWFESQARMSPVWFDPTEPASATEHYKSKYQATSPHEFGLVRTTRSHEFGVVRPYRTHESLWPDTCSCC